MADQENSKKKKILRNKLSYCWRNIFDYFGITRYFIQSNRLTCVCPVHCGDNESAFNLNIDENSEYFGNWFCNSHRCHEKFGKDSLGLLHGIMYSLDDQAKFQDALKLAQTLTRDCKFNEDIRDNDTITNFLLREKKEDKTKISRTTVRSKLLIPSPWYINNRNFSPEILDEFDVGDCQDDTSQMRGRTVFPVYSEDGKYMVGCTGRRHDSGINKWINSKGFNKSAHLYAYHRAIKRAKELSSIILVEGQGDVIRMHEHGIINTVGLFGLSLSESQEFMLQKSGVLNIILALDNNQAGREASQKLEKQLGYFFNIHRVNIPANDIGEMTNLEVIREQIRNFI